VWGGGEGVGEGGGKKGKNKFCQIKRVKNNQGKNAISTNFFRFSEKARGNE